MASTALGTSATIHTNNTNNYLNNWAKCHLVKTIQANQNCGVKTGIPYNYQAVGGCTSCRPHLWKPQGLFLQSIKLILLGDLAVGKRLGRDRTVNVTCTHGGTTRTHQGHSGS